MNPTLMPVEKAILECVTATSRALYSQQVQPGKWTREILTNLCKLGEQEFRLHAWASIEGKSEWLWDLAWVRHGPGTEKKKGWMDFRGVFLAGEIEWKTDMECLLADFLKLAVAVADYRLFICTIPNKPQKRWAEIMERLLRACPGSRGFRYLAIGVFNSELNESELMDGYLPHMAWTL